MMTRTGYDHNVRRPPRRRLLNTGIRHLRRGLVRQAGGALAVRAIGAVSSFAVHLLLARVLGGEQYGLYLYALACVGVLSILGKFGLDTLLTRQVAAYSATSDWGLLTGLLRSALGLGLGVGGSLGVGLWVVAGTLGARTDTLLAPSLLLASPLVPLVCLVALQQGALRGLKRVVAAQVPEFLITPAIVGGLTVLWSVGWGAPLVSTDVLIFHGIAGLTAVIAGAWWLFRSLPRGAWNLPPRYALGQWIHTALPLTLLSGLNTVFARADVLIIGLVLGTTEAGLYHVARRFADLPAFGLLAVNAAAAPRIASAFAVGDIDSVRRHARVAAWTTCVYVVPVAVVLVAMGPTLLRWVGERFPEAYPALVALALGQLVSGLCGSAGQLLIMTRHQSVATRIFAGALMVNLVLSVVMIALFGMAGAGVATALSVGLWKVGNVVAAHMQLGINPTVFSR